MECKYSFIFSRKYEHRQWHGCKQETYLMFLLLSDSCVNSISHLKITNMYLTDTECTFVFDDVLKHSRPSFK